MIDLNCDLGESFGPWPMGNDLALLPFLTSVNIACGFHAGDAMVMRHTVRLSIQHGVALGAHPGYPDLQGFGRRAMSLSPAEVYAITLYQIGALRAIAEAEGGKLHHVKPHGALYNTAAKDRTIADAIAEAVYKADPTLWLYGLSGSALIHAAEARGLRACSEVFADRSYEDDGSLTPRQQPGALLDNAHTVVAQCLHMARNHQVVSRNGRPVSLQSETLCLHGDGPHAEEFARAIATAFREAGIGMKAP